MGHSSCLFIFLSVATLLTTAQRNQQDGWPSFDFMKLRNPGSGSVDRIQFGSEDRAAPPPWLLPKQEAPVSHHAPQVRSFFDDEPVASPTSPESWTSPVRSTNIKRLPQQVTDQRPVATYRPTSRVQPSAPATTAKLPAEHTGAVHRAQQRPVNPTAAGRPYYDEYEETVNQSHERGDDEDEEIPRYYQQPAPTTSESEFFRAQQQKQQQSPQERQIYDSSAEEVAEVRAFDPSRTIFRTPPSSAQPSFRERERYFNEEEYRRERPQSNKRPQQQRPRHPPVFQDEPFGDSDWPQPPKSQRNPKPKPEEPQETRDFRPEPTSRPSKKPVQQDDELHEWEKPRPHKKQPEEQQHHPFQDDSDDPPFFSRPTGGGGGARRPPPNDHRFQDHPNRQPEHPTEDQSHQNDHPEDHQDQQQQQHQHNKEEEDHRPPARRPNPRPPSDDFNHNGPDSNNRPEFNNGPDSHNEGGDFNQGPPFNGPPHRRPGPPRRPPHPPPQRNRDSIVTQGLNILKSVVGIPSSPPQRRPPPDGFRPEGRRPPPGGHRPPPGQFHGRPEPIEQSTDIGRSDQHRMVDELMDDPSPTPSLLMMGAYPADDPLDEELPTLIPTAAVESRSKYRLADDEPLEPRARFGAEAEEVQDDQPSLFVSPESRPTTSIVTIVPETTTTTEAATEPSTSTLFPPFSKRVRPQPPPAQAATTESSAGQLRITSYKQRIEAMKERARQREQQQQKPEVVETSASPTSTSTSEPTTTTPRPSTTRPRIPPRMPSRKPVISTTTISPFDEADLPSFSNKKRIKPVKLPEEDQEDHKDLFAKIPPNPFERRRAQQQQQQQQEQQELKDGPLFSKLHKDAKRRQAVRSTTIPPPESINTTPVPDEEPKIELISIINDVPSPLPPADQPIHHQHFEERQSFQPETTDSVSESLTDGTSIQADRSRHNFYDPILPIEELLNIRVRDNGKGM